MSSQSFTCFDNLPFTPWKFTFSYYVLQNIEFGLKKFYVIWILMFYCTKIKICILIIDNCFCFSTSDHCVLLCCYHRSTKGSWFVERTIFPSVSLLFTQETDIPRARLTPCAACTKGLTLELITVCWFLIRNFIRSTPGFRFHVTHGASFCLSNFLLVLAVGCYVVGFILPHRGPPG
jgi:hypothetical protein